MAHAVDLQNLERRSTQYWNIDGIPELGMGLLWITWGAAWLFGDSLERGSTFRIYWFITPALLALSSVAAVWAIKYVKQRITFPRTGYVEWKAPSTNQRLTAAGVALGTASVLVLVSAVTRDLDGSVMMPALGALFSLAFLVASLRQRAPHLLALAGVAVALGVTFGALKLGWESANWLFVWLGVATTLVGAVRLRLFLKRYPIESGQ